MAKKQRPQKQRSKESRSRKFPFQLLCYPGSPAALDDEYRENILNYDPENPETLRQSLKPGYVLLLENRPLQGKLSPAEFNELELPEHTAEKSWWNLKFRGEDNKAADGLILSSEALEYVLAIRTEKQSLKPAFIRMVLGMQGFSEKEVQLGQHSPLEAGRTDRLSLRDSLFFKLSWSTTLPLRESRDARVRGLFFIKEAPFLRLLFLFLTVISFILLPILSLDAGLSGDDEKHYQHAEKVHRYFTEDDPSALDDPQYKLNFYGQSFDYFSYLIIKAFRLEDNAYEARHVMVALSGAAAILFTALLVKLFAGYTGALLALVLMFLSPRFLGHAFNNPMDVPFLLGNVFTIYFMIRFLKKLPRFSMGTAFLIALGIGWSNGIRIGGLLLIPYLFMFSGLYLLIRRWPFKFFSKDWWVFAMKGMGILVLISMAGYLLSVLTWPYALQDIVNHPAQAFKVMTNIQVSIRVLYEGVIHWSDKLPWHYIPRNIWLTVPVIVLLGFMISPLVAILDRKQNQAYWYFVLWFTVLFPIIFIIIRESNVYGGWRHMMFIYPSMLALAAISLGRLWQILPRGWPTYLLAALVIAGIFHPLRHSIRNHPNTYIYFNEWAGGINRTYGRLETDFYANSLGPASEYFIDEILPGVEEEIITIVSNFTIGYYFRNEQDRVRTLYSRYYDLGKKDWDYAILYCNYLHPYHLQDSFWPPKNTIHEVKVDDVVVAAIVERKSRSNYYGSTLLSEGMLEQDPDKLEQALHYLEDAIAYDPHDMISYLELANVYTGFLQFDKVRELMDRLLEVFPDYDKALNMKGYSYLVQSEYTGNKAFLDDAIRWINASIHSNYKFYSGYYNLGLCYDLKGDIGNAEYNLKQAIKFNARFVEAYEKLAELYEKNGDTEMAQRVRRELNRRR